MTDQPPHAGHDGGHDADRGSPAGMPRWVKVAGIIVGILVLLFVVLQLTGLGGEHGPGRHGDGSDTPPPGVTVELAADQR